MAIGVIILIMALILILPLPPGGNFPPALACAILGMGRGGAGRRDRVAGISDDGRCRCGGVLLVEFVIDALPGITSWFASTFGFK